MSQIVLPGFRIAALSLSLLFAGCASMAPD